MIQRNPSSLSRVGSNPVVKTPPTSQFAGDSILSLKIKKTSTNGSPIGAFPVPLFASIHSQSQYSAIQQRLPSGYTLTSVVNTADGNRTITYGDGGATNVIELTISSNTLPYTSIVAALLYSVIKASVTKLTVSADEADLASQFNEDIDLFNKSIFGGAKTNSVQVGINAKPSDFRKDMLNITQPIKMGPEDGIIVYFNAESNELNFDFATSNYVIGKNNL